MEPYDADRFDDLDGLAFDFEPPSLVEPDAGDGGPPLPPRDEGGEPRRSPAHGPHPHDHEVFSWWVFSAAVVLFVATTSLQVFCLGVGAQGGPWLAGALSLAFLVLFVVPFVVGSVWFGRRRLD